jgi:hypothetical protein
MMMNSHLSNVGRTTNVSSIDHEVISTTSADAALRVQVKEVTEQRILALPSKTTHRKPGTFTLPVPDSKFFELLRSEYSGAEIALGVHTALPPGTTRFR